MEVLKVVLLAIVLMAIIMVGLAWNILFKKDGQFPNTHIGGNEHLKARGVSCATSYDKMEQAKARKEIRFKELSIKESEGEC